jgi:hypothetical protein
VTPTSSNPANCPDKRAPYRPIDYVEGAARRLASRISTRILAHRWSGRRMDDGTCARDSARLRLLAFFSKLLPHARRLFGTRLLPLRKNARITPEKLVDAPGQFFHNSRQVYATFLINEQETFSSSESHFIRRRYLTFLKYNRLKNS